MKERQGEGTRRYDKNKVKDNKERGQKERRKVRKLDKEKIEE